MPGSYVTLILMLLALGALTATVIVITLAFSVLRPPRLTDGLAIWRYQRLSPGDFALKFESVSFNIRDEQTGQPLRIAGWWIRHEQANGRCVVLLHGFADAKVGAIAWAPLWHSLGCNIVAIDLRAHGESGGVNSTAGYWERHDVAEVLDQLRSERAADTRQIVLFGVGVGAAIAVAAAEMRDDLLAVVLESPPADVAHAAKLHMDRLGAPGGIFQTLALSLAQQMAQCNFAAVRPIDLIKKISCPAMIVAPAYDPTVSDADKLAMQQSLQSRGRGEDVYWPVDNGTSLPIDAEPQRYEESLRDFLRGIK